jgi:tetratricopeptide (TPR) repeat protein
MILNKVSSGVAMSDCFPTPKRIVSTLAGAAAIALSLWVNPTLAGDPFRTSNPRLIGQKTEAAFNAIFKDGNYREAAESLLPQAATNEPNEPLIYAMQASLTYTDWQANNKEKALLDQIQSDATKTRQFAEQLQASDPVRGNLYIAVSHGLEAATILEQEGTVRGAPKALSKLQQVYQSLEAAEKIAPQDPELNLIKGWMDLLIAVNLPFSDPTEAIARLEKAGPNYLAYRGIAVGYRDLKQYDKAFDYVNRALAASPNHPELHYLKAQILVKLNRREEAKADFQAALAKSPQLPKSLVAQIFFEQCRSQHRANDQKRGECVPKRNQIRDTVGKWGPVPNALPSLD